MLNDDIQAFATELDERSESKCELCSSVTGLVVAEVPSSTSPTADTCVLICEMCAEQLEQPVLSDNHWRCLQESAWSQVPAVQVLAWRTLGRIPETWAQDLRDQMYLDEPTLEWANTGAASADDVVTEPTLDSNGTPLATGDTVVVIKDLDVKGGGFTAKRGTTVKNIRLTSNPEHVEGRVNKTLIVLKTCFLKKSS